MINSNFFRSKIDNFQRKIFDIFLIFAQNIDCGYTLEPPRRGGSNEYPQSMFWSKNKKNRYTLLHGHVLLMSTQVKDKQLFYSIIILRYRLPFSIIECPR